MGQQALVMEALKSGAMDFVTKPYDKEQLLETIKKGWVSPTRILGLKPNLRSILITLITPR